MTYSRPWPWPWGLSANSKKVPWDIWWQVIKTSFYTLPGPDNTLKWIFSILAFNTTWKFTERHKKKNDIPFSRLSLNPYKTQPSSLCYCSQINISSQSLKFLPRLGLMVLSVVNHFDSDTLIWPETQHIWTKLLLNPCSVLIRRLGSQVRESTQKIHVQWVISSHTSYHSTSPSPVSLGSLVSYFTSRKYLSLTELLLTLPPITLIQTLTKSLHPFFINSDRITSWNTSTLNQMLITFYWANGAAA